MKSRSEEFEEWGTEVIFGRAKGFRAAMMRMILRGASWLFRLVVLARLYLFHSSIARQARLGMLVVSVGNITVGGTGKTPVAGPHPYPARTQSSHPDTRLQERRTG